MWKMRIRKEAVVIRNLYILILSFWTYTKVVRCVYAPNDVTDKDQIIFLCPSESKVTLDT